jgi:hypothetical protein
MDNKSKAKYSPWWELNFLIKSIEDAMVRNPHSRNMKLKKEEKESAKNIPPKSSPFCEVKERNMVMATPIKAK